MARYGRLTTALLISVTAALLAPACGGDDEAPPTPGALEAPLAGSGAVFEALQAAADAHDVPIRLLVAAAYSETRLAHVDSEKEGRGLFQLDPLAIDRAARLLDVPAEQVAADLETHALAFAALVADNVGSPRPDADDLPQWLDAVAGVRTADVAAVALSEGTRIALREGLDVELADGRISLAPAPLGTLTQAARPDSNLARWVASPNFTNASRRRGAVDTVVIHVTQGAYGGAISWFQNRNSQVSSHYIVRSSDGQITQMVEEEDVAWHARSWNGRSIGIEHEGFVDEPRWFTDAMYRQSAALTREICDRWGIPKNRQGIKGHNELSGNDHTDPGRHWNWERYMQLVNGGGGGDPAPAGGRVLGFVREGDIMNEAGAVANARVRIEGGPEVRTAANGLYTFEGQASGHKVILVTADGFAPARREVDHVAGQDTWGSVALQRGQATGNVLGFVREGDLMNADAPIAGARVAVDGGPTVQTGADGLYRLEGLPVGDVRITISKDGWQSQTIERTVAAGADSWGSVGLQPVEAEQPEPEQPEPEQPEPERPNPERPEPSPRTTGAVVGAVRAAAGGQSIEGAIVSVTGVASVTTEADGAFRIAGLAPGPVEVSALAAGYATLTRTLTIEAGVDTPFDAALAPRAEVPPQPADPQPNDPPRTGVDPGPKPGGDYEAVPPPPPVDEAPAMEKSSGSGGCTQAPGAPAGAPWLLLLGAAALVTRRRAARR